MKTEVKVYLESLVGKDGKNSMAEVMQELKRQLIEVHKMDKRIVVNFNANEIKENLDRFNKKTEVKFVPDLPDLPELPSLPELPTLG